MSFPARRRFLASIAMLPSKGVTTMQIDRQLVSKKDLKTIGIPYSFQHIARLEKAGHFPKRIQLGQCRVAWCYKEVSEWIAERIARRDPAHSG
jgi:prophage regulatory protein